MTQISNDTEFKQALSGLDLPRQRAVAALFVENVLSLSGDERLARVVRAASNPDASDDELASALKEAKAVSLDSYARCGAEGDWTAQAGYFVARAAEATVMPEAQIKSGGPAWQAAMSCRMARTCVSIDSGEDTTNQESEQQYRILADFLNS